MFFVGTYPLTIDSKGRLSIPFVVRDRMMSAERDGKAYYVLPGRQSRTLMLYPDEYFRRTHQGDFPFELISPQTYAWQQFAYSQGVLAEPDSQGRVLIPERLLKRVGLEREVVLIGVQDHLELWTREDYDAFEEQRWQNYNDGRDEAVEELHRLGAFGAAAVAEPAEMASSS